jgi:hypothetical protein
MEGSFWGMIGLTQSNKEKILIDLKKRQKRTDLKECLTRSHEAAKGESRSGFRSVEDIFIQVIFYKTSPHEKSRKHK